MPNEFFEVNFKTKNASKQYFYYFYHNKKKYQLDEC